ncbi:hypothetical protein GMORB2_3468 [Geosmithia morbida]|uniref:DUF3824 domain-containing protein n=1 Tax=Geosmithia morbida TaxID=1094350 RepID=A0A9P4YP95_9HYPO|nr:uncharacterized protein GMORB2_3468 [Geosmithia morbida]KAF4120057.1 hypothetical protein GMORB2_3468 [Geosmithia morbida]
MGDVHHGSRYKEYDDQSDDDGYSRTTVRRYKVKPGRNGNQHQEVVEVGEDYRPQHSEKEHRSHDDYQLQDGYEYDSQSRQPDGVKVQRQYADHWDHDRGYDVERYRKETEYYTPRPELSSEHHHRRDRDHGHDHYVPESPRTAVDDHYRHDYDPNFMVLRNKDHRHGRELAPRDRFNDDYYYHRESRRLDPDRERTHALARYDRYRRDQGYSSDEGDHRTRRRLARRERSESPPHHKRELAIGALAGAGLTALINSRLGEDGELPEHRGQKVLAGGTLGLLGTEALRRAHSAYGDRFHDHSPDSHSSLKKGLSVAAVALAAAGAANAPYSRSASRGRSLSTAAKAAFGAAATAGIANHIRSKSRGGSRSKSRLRRVAEMGGAAALAGVAGKAYQHHQKKKSRSAERSRDLGGDDEESDHGHNHRRSSHARSSRTRSRSTARSLHRSDAGSEPQLGLVEYGHGPLSPSQRSEQQTYEDEERRHRRRKRRGSPGQSDYESTDASSWRSRSRSRIRDMAAAGATALGIKEYKDKKDQEKREWREQRDERTFDPDQDSRPPRQRSRRRHNEEPDDYFDDPPPRHGSPPVASGGGAYYPPYPATPGSGATSGGYTQFPTADPQQTYIPQDYTGYPPPPAPVPPPAGQPPSASGYVPPPPPQGTPRHDATLDNVSPDATVTRGQGTEGA